ncbi:MAG: electron transport complex subunit RsxB [Pseudomonadota bacterium]
MSSIQLAIAHSWLPALAVLGALTAAAALSWRWRQQAPDPGREALAKRIDRLLPQTQCGRCGHPGCLPYARAVAGGEAFNRCPPGGDATIAALADLLGSAPRPLDPAHGAALPPRVARIREAECIGCTKCLPACPVDAIVGGPRHLHTVIAALCTGCDLCIDPCPVDCIEMIAAPGSEGRPTAGRHPGAAA